MSNDPELIERARMIANHGSKKKYYNEIVGINSRLDTIQAAILRVKLRHLDRYTRARQAAAAKYDRLFSQYAHIECPAIASDRDHVFHQYTVRVPQRDAMAAHLKAHHIPSAIYYPVPINRLPVFEGMPSAPLPETEKACSEVLSLPMHTELTSEQQHHIASVMAEFYQASPVAP